MQQLDIETFTTFSAREWGTDRPEFYYVDQLDHETSILEGFQWAVKSGSCHNCLNTDIQIRDYGIMLTHELVDGSIVHREIFITHGSESEVRILINLLVSTLI